MSTYTEFVADLLGYDDTQHGQDLTGTPEDEVLLGTISDDVVFANTGDDLIIGSYGSDNLHGAGGDDIIIADTTDSMVAGGGGFDVAFISDETPFWGNDWPFGQDSPTEFDMVDSARGIEAVVGYGVDDISLNVSLSSILGQSQNSKDADASLSTDNTFIALGLESLTLEGVGKFTDGYSTEVSVQAVELSDAVEDAYFEMVFSTAEPFGDVDLYAYTFEGAEGDVTIITDLTMDDVSLAETSLSDMGVEMA